MSEEGAVSYWRRIVQARLDVLKDASALPPQPKALAEILADARNSPTRVAHLSLMPAEDLAVLPDLAQLWHAVDLAETDAQRAELAEKLRAAERRLSVFRSQLHERIDALTSELISRYREDPRLALAALPNSTP